MLDTFRQAKLIRISVLTIAFALMVKMLMPIAHASTAMSGERTGFFAVLCKTSMRIQAEKAIAKADTQAAQHAHGHHQAHSKHHDNHQQHDEGHQHDANQASNIASCPLCLLLEQTFYDSTTLFASIKLGVSFNTTFKTEYQPFYSNHKSLLSSIRAPPTFS